MSNDLMESVNEEHLQRFAGLNSKASAIAPHQACSEQEETVPGHIEEPIEEEQAEEEEQVVVFQTKKTKIWTLPLPKLLLAGGMVAFVLLVGFIVTGDLMKGKIAKPEQVPAPKPVANKPVDPQTQAATLQTEVALGRSGVEIDRLNAKQKDQKNGTKPTAQATGGSTPQAPAGSSYNSPPPPPIVNSRSSSPILSSESSSPPVTSRRQVTDSEPPTNFSSRSNLVPPSTSSRSSNPTASVASAVPVEDPAQKWMALANVGNFGNGQGGQTVGDFPTTVANSAVPTGGIGTPPVEVSYQPAKYQTSSTTSTPSENSSLQLPSGAKVEGKLQTPLAWSGSGQRQALPKLRIKLKKSLGSIPAGAEIIAQITNADNSGLLQLAAVAVQEPDGQSISLASDALSFFGEGGKPLQAHYHGPRSGGGNGLFSKLGNVAGMFGSSSNFDVLSRMQNRQSSSQSQPIYYTLDEGIVIVIYVN